MHMKASVVATHKKNQTINKSSAKSEQQAVYLKTQHISIDSKQHHTLHKYKLINWMMVLQP